MLFFRVLIGLLALAAVACFAMYIGTRDLAWRGRGIAIVKWTVFGGLFFFAVLIVQRLVEGA